MARLLYNLLWYPALPFALLYSHAVDAQEFRERIGIAAPRLVSKAQRLWVHAASVGEIEAVHAIATRLLRAAPGSAAVVTTMTPAGRVVARHRMPRATAWMLAPLDCPSTVRAFLARVRPTLLMVAETELWPNYFLEAHRAGARIAIVNGRLSERSLARYRRMRSLFGRALECADLVLAQTAADAERFAQLGAARERIAVTGNTKFDPDAAAETPLRRELASFAAGRPILIAGSTAAGEEEVVLDAYLKLRAGFPALALVVAPRHLVRARDVERMIAATGLAHVRASDLAPNAAADIMLLDTMGELRGLYRRAAVAFVGGSLVLDRGGQNPAEPAAASVPVLFGPHHQNQSETAAALIAGDGAQIVSSADEMVRACAGWLGDEQARSTAGRRARECIERLSGGVNASLMRLRGLINLA
jgi:3-deoxy-D-manno-octulosonic-acid transferase